MRTTSFSLLLLLLEPYCALACALELCELGFTVLPSRIEPTLVARACRASHIHLSSLLDLVSSVGCDPVEQCFSFAECDHRQRLRYDMSLPDGAEAWSELCDRAFELAAPTIEAATGGTASMTMAGAVTSRPGATLQTLHRDGAVEGLFAVFVPLVDIQADGDGTAFVPGSHLRRVPGSYVQRPMLSTALDVALGRVRGLEVSAPSKVAPACLAGQPLIFDYRVLHQGLASPPEAEGGRERPVAYVVVSANGATDSVNFEQQSLQDLSPADVENIPFWGDFEPEAPSRLVAAHRALTGVSLALARLGRVL